MAKLSIEYDKDGKLNFKFEENDIDSDMKLIQNLFKIADSIAIEVVAKDDKLGDKIDEAIVNLCAAFLASSERYEANKKVISAPIPAIHPLLSFGRFKK